MQEAIKPQVQKAIFLNRPYYFSAYLPALMLHDVADKFSGIISFFQHPWGGQLMLNLSDMPFCVLFSETNCIGSRWESITGKFTSNITSGTGGKFLILVMIFSSLHPFPVQVNCMEIPLKVVNCVMNNSVTVSWTSSVCLLGVHPSPLMINGKKSLPYFLMHNTGCVQHIYQ